ncbi:MAG: hypothetical protein KBS70_05740 [Bacteroidales bacterium]|nr:hypothetical protein [Candidatus Colicola equi]
MIRNGLTFRIFLGTAPTDEYITFNADILQAAGISIERAKENFIRNESKRIGCTKRTIQLVKE